MPRLQRETGAHRISTSRCIQVPRVAERRLNVGAGFATPGFWLERADGSWTDFSFPTAISAKPKPQSQEFADACRGVVASDLRAAKLRHFKTHGDEQGRVPCDITGQLITINEAHLDHAHWPFGTLIAMFREARGWHEVRLLPITLEMLGIFCAKPKE